MKALTLQAPDGSPAPAGDFGSVPPGTTSVSRALQLLNTGDEAITSVRMYVQQASSGAGVYRVTANSLELTTNLQEVLSGPLNPGDSIGLLESVSTPPGVTVTGPDTATLVWEYDQ